MTVAELRRLNEQLDIPRLVREVDQLLEIVARKRGRRPTYRMELPSAVRCLGDALAALNAAVDQLDAAKRDAGHP